MCGKLVKHGNIIGRLGADHRRPADIDVLDAVVVARAFGDGFLERIEVYDQQIDRFDVVRLHRSDVFMTPADRQEAAMHTGM